LGFFHEVIAGHQDGFAVFLDVNQDEAQAAQLLAYIKAGVG